MVSCDDYDLRSITYMHATYTYMLHTRNRNTGSALGGGRVRGMTACEDTYSAHFRVTEILIIPLLRWYV